MATSFGRIFRNIEKILTYLNLIDSINFSSDRDHRLNVIFFDLCSDRNCDKICYVLALRVIAILGLTPKLQRIPGLLSVGTKAFAVSLRRRQGQRLSPIGVNNQPESHEKSRFHPSLDPPRIPLVVGGL